jgi:uncharacterized protein
MAHPVCWFEIGCRDKEKTAKFFSDLFDWEIKPEGMAWGISGSGLGGHITSLGHEPHHYVTIYIEVDDVAASLAKAVSLGGKTLVPPVEIPQGTFAWFTDPDGTPLGLWKSKS